MGREWYWGGGGKSSRREDKGGRRREEEEHQEETKGNGSLPSGCMCAVFQWFDFHQFQFATNNTILQQQLPPSPPPTFKTNSFTCQDSHSSVTTGVEAPGKLNNVLELTDSSFSSTTKEVEHLDAQMKKQRGIQIKTSIGTSKALNRKQPSEAPCPYSPGSKTPNLVARLMGLDLLPHSPSSSTSSLISPPTSLRASNNQPLQSKPNHLSGTRSLPETPRISSARRSDVDRRLSLQINKENISPCEELVLSRISMALKRKELNLVRKEEAVSVQGKSCSSPRNLAKQMVKQVKENVNRRVVGLDITNTVINNIDKLHHKSRAFNDLHGEYTKKLVSKVSSSSRDVINSDRYSSSTCSPRLRFLDINSKLSNKEHLLKDVSNFTPKLQGHEKVDVETRRVVVKGKQEELRSKTCKRPIQTRSVALRNKHEEPFVRPTTVVVGANASVSPDQKKKCKRDPTPPATKIPHKQESIRRPQPTCPNPSYKLKEVFLPGDNTNSTTSNNNKANQHWAFSTTATAPPVPEHLVAERDYVITLLKRTGLHPHCHVSSFTRWFSPSHPLDPSIFYYLEHFTDVNITPGQLNQRCNRKLLFQLVDEILVDVLRPYVGGPCPNGLGRMKGSDLVDFLCTKIRSFPSVDCRVLEDIDGLIDGDMLDWKGQNELGFDEERKGIVCDVEKHVLDSLVHETAVVLYSGLALADVMGTV